MNVRPQGEGPMKITIGEGHERDCGCLCSRCVGPEYTALTAVAEAAKEAHEFYFGNPAYMPEFEEPHWGARADKLRAALAALEQATSVLRDGGGDGA